MATRAQLESIVVVGGIAINSMDIGRSGVVQRVSESRPIVNSAVVFLFLWFFWGHIGTHTETEQQQKYTRKFLYKDHGMIDISIAC